MSFAVRAPSTSAGHWSSCLVVGAAALWLPHVVALLVCFLLVTTGTAAYERVYARAAEATRSRLR